VSITAGPGQVTGLIGPNGSGKTTIVRVASRGLAPRSGQVHVAGVDPYAVSARLAARSVAVVPQDLAPAFDYSVLEMVMMGRSPYLSPWGGGRAEDWDRARWAMTAAGVQHLGDRPLGELSGGERQRVILAQALAQDAPVLLLDEPTTHLDIRHVVDILSLAQRLARTEGRAVLAIFHDLNLASSCCDQIYALDQGRVVARGSAASVITRSLVRDVFRIDAEVEPSGVAGRPMVLIGTPIATGPAAWGATRAHVIGGAGRGAGAMRALAEAGFEVSAGVLHDGDTDALLAERLNLIRVVVPPFSRIDPRSASDCARMIAEADLLVVCDAPFGMGNEENLRLALEAIAAGTRVCVIEEMPIEERDFTGGRATALWHEIRSRARVVGSVEELRSVIGR
jgi:iron complex transport system ATP-binding protein